MNDRKMPIESSRITAEEVAKLRRVGVNRVREEVRSGIAVGVVREGRRLLFDRPTVLASLGLTDAVQSTDKKEDFLCRLAAACRAFANVLDSSNL